MVIIEIIILLIELVILAVIWGDRKGGYRAAEKIEPEHEERREEQLRKDWNEGMTNMMAFTYEDAIKAAREEREHGKL